MGGRGGAGGYGRGQSLEEALSRYGMLERAPSARGQYGILEVRPGAWSVVPASTPGAIRP